MVERSYGSAKALEMAVKAAARKSGQEVNKAIEAYYPGRLLERIFSESNPSFVLKGGRGILARTVDARYTRDTDVLYEGADLNEALNELIRLASVDLGDFLEFRFVSSDRIAENQEYREGLKVVFEPVLGGTKRMGLVSVDLVVDQVSAGEADIITPANRLDVEGLPVFDYHVYPVVSAVADKVCATMQPYPGGRSSSRVRDLVDLVVYVTMEEMDGRTLSQRILRESRSRRIGVLDHFEVPESWHTTLSRNYEKSAKEAKLPSSLLSVDVAESLVKSCVDPAISGEADGRFWSPESRTWLERGQ